MEDVVLQPQREGKGSALWIFFVMMLEPLYLAIEFYLVLSIVVIVLTCWDLLPVVTFKLFGITSNIIFKSI